MTTLIQNRRDLTARKFFSPQRRYYCHSLPGRSESRGFRNRRSRRIVRFPPPGATKIRLAPKICLSQIPVGQVSESPLQVP